VTYSALLGIYKKEAGTKKEVDISGVKHDKNKGHSQAEGSSQRGKPEGRPEAPEE